MSGPRETVADRIARMEERRTGYAERGFQPAVDSIDGVIARLRTYGDDHVLLTATEVYFDAHHIPWLSDVERWAVMWQRRRDLPLSEVEIKLLDLAEVCDSNNLDRLAEGWPALVTMIREWRNGDLAERLRGMPFEFSI